MAKHTCPKTTFENFDKLEGATEYKVWANYNSSAEYFDTLSEALKYYESAEGDKTLEAIFRVITYEESPTHN